MMHGKWCMVTVMMKDCVFNLPGLFRFSLTSHGEFSTNQCFLTHWLVWKCNRFRIQFDLLMFKPPVSLLTLINLRLMPYWHTRTQRGRGLCCFLRRNLGRLCCDPLAHKTQKDWVTPKVAWISDFRITIICPGPRWYKRCSWAWC